MGGRRSVPRGAAICLALLGGWTGASAAEPPDGIALTLSGLPSAPRAERSLRVGDEPTAITFRAPIDADLRAVHLLWRRAADGCTVTLRGEWEDGDGAALAIGTVPPGNGWRASTIDASITAGARYRLALDCPRGSRARLAYVLDGERAGVASGAWQLGGRSAGARAASPLFALELADGGWWGHPYRALRRSLRLCGRREVATVFSPARPTEAAGLELAAHGATGRTSVAYTVAALDGTPLLAGSLFRAPGARTRLVPAASDEGVTLVPGVSYVLRLSAPNADGGCVVVEGLTTDLDLGPPATGMGTIGVSVSDDGGGSWRSERVSTLPALFSSARGRRCGDGQRQGHEACDAPDDGACPGRCTSSCTCAAPATTTTITITTTTTQPPTTTTRPSTTSTTTRPSTTTSTTTTTRPANTTTTLRRFRSIYASGYLGVYDPQTISVWPRRLGMILGGPDGQGSLIQNAKQVAIAAGNTDARFVFYLSLTSLDARCNCFEARFYNGITTAHPEFFLRDANGSRISTFVTQYGAGRLWAVDLGNLGFIDAWADTVIAEMTLHGWDGVWADNVLRGNFYDWSAWPVNPRTGQRYTTAEYRRDTLAALQRLRQRLDARGKILIGNYGSAWESDTFADPVVQQQILAMHGLEIEDCVYTFGGQPHPESTWIDQLKYLDFANRRGVLTQCRGGNGTIGDATKRDYILASYLLTKEGFSNVGQLNGLNAWWPGLEVDLGAPRGGFVCLDPAAGLAPTATCPSAGKIYRREWERGRVLVNPSATRTVTVPLGESLLRNGSLVTSVTLGPRSGAVLVRP